MSNYCSIGNKQVLVTNNNLSFLIKDTISHHLIVYHPVYVTVTHYYTHILMSHTN